MNYYETASGVLKGVGGADNIGAFQHCSTRLRFNLADDAKANVTALKAVPGVLGVVKSGGQTQVIIGNDVVEIYDALAKLPGVSSDGSVKTISPAKGAKSIRSAGATVLDFIVAVFQPLVPALAGAGILKSFLTLFAALGWMDVKSPTYVVLISIPNAVFFFLPLLVAVTTANKLNCNRLVALSAVSVLVLPATATLLATEGGSYFLGIPLTNVAYGSQVFPAILSVLFLAWMERIWTKITPKPIRIFFVPMMCLLITVPVTLLLLGPVGFQLGQALTTAILFIYAKLGWVATALLAAALPFIIAVGMHKALLPYALNQLSATGAESLYLPASLAHNIAESGASFGVAIRTKSLTMRSTAVAAGVSALFGITEPALYGVTLQNKRALYSVLAGCLTGGAYVGLTHVAGYVAVGPGVASLSLFVNPTDPWNLINACIGAAIAFAVSITASLILWKDAESATLIAEHDPAAGIDEDTDGQVTEQIVNPLAGEVIALSSVNDPVFAGGTLGDGVAIVPSDGEVHSPIEGTVAMLFDTKHAIAVKSDSGVEVLIHVGIDTVKLGGQYFTPAVAKGDRVTAGQLLLTADLDGIKTAGYDTTTPVVILNTKDFHVDPSTPGTAQVGDRILSVTAKEIANV